MLKILIIDDDMLTRKGIQTLMPWEKHGMEIIGEASNGKAALEFLKEHQVDLALVDLDMPIMNGTTFIREAKKLYPHLNYVVLTVHTEFEYIQPVLRLGVIDYIAKTQFDQENFDLILERINASISKKLASFQAFAPVDWKKNQILYPHIYALVSMEPETDSHISMFWDLNQLTQNPDIYELIPGCWTFYSDTNRFVFPAFFPNTSLLCIADVSGMTYESLAKLLRNYKNEQFFYDYQPIHAVNYKRAHELKEVQYVDSTSSLEHLKEKWASLNWVYENTLFDQFKIDLKNNRLKPSTLYHLMLSLENIWNTSYGSLSGDSIKLPASFHSWLEVEEWLTAVYEKTNLFSSSFKYSPEVTQNILAAKLYVDTHLSSVIVTSQAAQNAHMSYGYFSRCFHDITGISFTDYCTQARIEKAKEYLLHTTNSIQQIASDTGYNDEKYFSRIFKKQTGFTPSDYRKKMGAP